MAAGISLVKSAAGDVPTPASGKVTVFVDSTSGEPSYKDDAGTAASLKGAQGDAGPTGAAGADGADGRSGTARYTYKENGAIGAANGEVSFDSGILSLGEDDADGTSVSGWLLEVGDSTNTSKGYFSLIEVGGTDKVVYEVTSGSALGVGGLNNYVYFSVTLLSGTPVVDTVYDVNFSATGDKGADGAGAWGSITGTLSSQTDLQSALDAKLATTVTTKGDLIVRDSTGPTRLAVGTNDYVLTADSTAATGMAWKAASGGGGGSSIIGVNLIEGDGSPAYTDLGLSDEFTSGTLNSNWTVVTGASGTVDWLALPASVPTTIYDLTTRPGQMLVQIARGDNSYLQMRAPVIADDEQLIVCMNINPQSSPATGNGFWCGMSVSGLSTSHDAGNYVRFVWDGTDNANMTTFDGSTVQSFKFDGYNTHRVYFRVVRISGGYNWSFSVDGVTWSSLGVRMPISSSTPIPAYLWIILGVRSSIATSLPANEPCQISTINWIRHCAYTGLDPW